MGSDELAYMSAAEIAERVRRRSLSPVEIVESCIARIERRNPSLNAFVFKGFDDARREARAAEAAVMSGGATGPLHGVPTAIKDLFDFKPGWPFTFGGVRAMKDCVASWHCVFAERIERGRRNHPRQDQQPNHGPARNLRQLSCSALLATHSTHEETRAALRAAARPPSRTDLSHLRREPTLAVRSEFPPLGATLSVSRRRSAAFPSLRAPMPSPELRPLFLKARSVERRRTPH